MAIADKPAVDQARRWVEVTSVLEEPEIINTPEAPSPVRRRWRRGWILLAILLLGLFLLNGPGVRWLGPKAAVHFLEKAGLGGKMKVNGSLLGGLSLSDVELETNDGSLKITVDEAIPKYRWSGLRQGRLESLTVDGVKVELKLGEEKEKSSPPDFSKLGDTLRSLRADLMPLELVVNDVTLVATRDEVKVFELASSRISHASNSSDFVLDLGVMTDATSREWPGRQTMVVWNADDLKIAQIDPLPGLSLRDVELLMPSGVEPSARVNVHVDEAIVAVSTTPGFRDVKMDLKEGRLDVVELAGRFGIVLPVAATVTSLAVELKDVLPEPRLTTGKASVVLESVVWRDLRVPKMAVDLELAEGEAVLKTDGQVLGSSLMLSAEAPVLRNQESWNLGEIEGDFQLANVANVVREMAVKVPAIDPAVVAPVSSLGGKFGVSLRDGEVQAANVNLDLKPQNLEVASGIKIVGSWEFGKGINAEVTADGLALKGSYQPESTAYEGKVEFTEFNSRRIDPWLAVFRAKIGAEILLTGNWVGKGEVNLNKHEGEVSLAQGSWTRGGVAPILASGGTSYAWPTNFKTRDLKLQVDEQTLLLDAAVADGMLDVTRILWSDGKQEIAEGSAALPVPEDLSRWRDAVATDKRPIHVNVESRELALALLKPWIPELSQIDPSSQGKVSLKITGTYLEPEVEAKLDLKNLRTPAQPQLPPADIALEMIGREGRLDLTGLITAPDLPASTIQASMGFFPAEWANNLELLKSESINATIDLPRLELARFVSLIPGAKEISGSVAGSIKVTGKVGKPVLKGSVDLTGAGIQFKDQRIFNVEGVDASLDLATDRIVLKSLKSTIAGGTVKGEGSVAIVGGALDVMDFKFQGDHMPLVRNQFLILRANADLRVLGTWNNAVISGKVGAVDSIFYRDIELLPIGQPFTTPSVAALPRIDTSTNLTGNIPEPFRSWVLDVLVKTEDPILLRGNLGTGEVVGSVKVGGTMGSPAPDGVVKVKDALADLPFSTMSVRSGTATFTPATGFDPILDIRGTAEPKPYQVTAYVTGRASDPQLFLTSNPPLPENEIMTLLATGTTTEGLEDPQAASSRALQLLVEELRRGRFRFGKQLRPVLALLDDVNFNLADEDPYSSETFSTATLKITDRWFLSAGLSATGDSRVLAIWRLTFH